MRATILAALAAAAILVVSACGSAGAVDSNLSSGQWNAVDGLLKKFPSSDRLLAKLRQQFEARSKVSVDDVKAAVGDELDVVVLPGAKKRYVGLTQPRDQAKFDVLVKKLNAQSE